MEKLDEKKICFIICTNEEQQLEECLMYLSLLEIPEGYETELLTIQDAKSMTSGYNEAMHNSNAKYKIYLHQDTFIVERKFLYHMLRIFQKDESIGLMGIVGAEKLSKDAVMWHEQRCGNFYRLDELQKEGFDNIEKVRKGYREVEVVDGLLMATQYDVPWREDILKGWDFYDVSQCLEFRRKGYRVVVPAQKTNWVIHACGAPSFWHYNDAREIVLKEYPEITNSKRLRILHLHSRQISLMGLAYCLTNMGHNVHIPTYKVTLWASSDAETEIIEEELEEGHYDLVVTYDFCPSVSTACQRSHVKYYAWVYDSPLLELYRDEACNPCNYISVFDRKQYARLKELNRIPHLFYLPLAAEVDVFGQVSIKKKDEKKYRADVAFVGRLYNNRGYEELFDENTKELKKEADAIVESCGCRWDGKTNLFGKATDELIQHICNKKDDLAWDVYHIDKRYYAESLKLIRRCNELERVEILNRLAEDYSVVLYSEKVPDGLLHNVTIRPWVDYWSEMPKVFYLSKINLNITSRSIESGIPQRIWDILAVGGFCLTNYQPELTEYFEIGKDLEVYHNMDELLEKVDYYLSHEEQRIRIAMNGYQKVRKYHTYRHRLTQALHVVFEEENGNRDI